MHNVCCVMHFMLHEQNQHLRESHVLYVCPLARHWCACHVTGCLVASPVPLQWNKDCKQPYSAIGICICIICLCVFFLTLDVYLLHLIDLCDSLSKLLCKLPELLSTWGAETYQLLLLWCKWAQHCDAMGVVWQKVSREEETVFTITLIPPKKEWRI